MSIQFQLLDRPYFLRRIIFAWTLIVASIALYWMFDFAKNSPRPGVDVAAIIGAINAPLSYLVSTILNAWKDVPAPSSVLGHD
jgi:hypothetical protein